MNKFFDIEKGWRSKWLWAFFTSPFLLFICEESAQLLGFGRFILIQGGLWEEHLAVLEGDKKWNILFLVLSIIDIPINPFSGCIFTIYFISERRKMKMEFIRAQNELWGFSDQTFIGGGDWNMTEFITTGRIIAIAAITVTILVLLFRAVHHRSRTQIPSVREEVTSNRSEMDGETEEVRIWSREEVWDALSKMSMSDEEKENALKFLVNKVGIKIKE